MADDKKHLTWDEVYQQSLDLATAIRSSDQQFDYLVVVPRGGYFVANIVARELGFGVTKLLHAGVGSYDSGQANHRQTLSIGEMPSRQNAQGHRLLIIDEVCDSGITLDYIKKYLIKAGATTVKSGVLHYKPANSQNGYVPDWFVGQTAQWIVYPWEEREFH